MGTPQSAVPSLERCVADGHQVVSVWTQPDRPAGRGHKVASSEVKQIAQSHGLQIEQPARIKNQEAKELFGSYKADVAVVVAYGKILPAEFLQAPKHGCINVHFSLLPSYRGAAPVNWAVMNGDPKTGVTTMFIEPELDSGPILLQHETTVGAKETAPELMDRLSVVGAELLSETLARLPEITPRPQNNSEATFAPMLRKEDGVINWASDALSLERRVRGLQPWPNAYTSFRGQRLIVWRADAVEHMDESQETGRVLTAAGDDLLIQCGRRTALRLFEVQPEAKRRMSVRDFLNGTHLKIGDKFGAI